LLETQDDALLPSPSVFIKLFLKAVDEYKQIIQRFPMKLARNIKVLFFLGPQEQLLMIVALI